MTDQLTNEEVEALFAEATERVLLQAQEPKPGEVVEAYYHEMFRCGCVLIQSPRKHERCPAHLHGGIKIRTLAMEQPSG